MRAAPIFALAAALAVTSAVRAQDDPREVAVRVHREGHYATDVDVPQREDDGVGGSTVDDPDRVQLDPGRDMDPNSGSPDISVPAWLDDFFEWLGSLFSGLGQPVGYLLLALGLAAIAMLVAYLVVRMRFPVPDATATPVEPRREEEVDPLLAGPALGADELAAQGRWGEAIHALFVRALDRVGGAEGRHRARTARELVRRVAAGRSGRAEIEELLGMTELVWFGGRAATEQQYRTAVALAGAVPAAVPAVAGEDDAEEAVA
jgi:hypothetical protein